MQVFGELSPREKRSEVVRWLLLVPAALLASSAVQVLVGAFVRAIRDTSATLNSSSISFWALAVPSYVLPELVFGIAGGWIARIQEDESRTTVPQGQSKA